MFVKKANIRLIIIRPMSRVAATISILVLGPGTTDAQLDDSHWSFSLESAYTFSVIRNPWYATFLGTVPEKQS